MQDKWDIQNNSKKKSYLKIHVAVNVKTKEILALKVTDEKVHDIKQMKALVEHVLKRNKNKNYEIKTTVLADGAYNSNKNFKYLNEKSILPGIKIRKNSIISTKNNKVRNSEVRSQTKEIFLNGKRKKDMDKDGLLKLHFHLSKECLVNMYLQPNCKTW